MNANERQAWAGAKATEIQNLAGMVEESRIYGRPIALWIMADGSIGQSDPGCDRPDGIPVQRVWVGQDWTEQYYWTLTQAKRLFAYSARGER